MDVAVWCWESCGTRGCWNLQYVNELVLLWADGDWASWLNLTVLLKLVLSRTQASRVNWGLCLPYLQMAGRSFQSTVDECGMIAPVVVHSQRFWDTFRIPATRSLYILAGAEYYGTVWH
jgi:hypothetical protein